MIHPKPELLFWPRWLRVCALCHSHWLINETFCQRCMEAVFCRVSKFATGIFAGRPPGYNFPVFSLAPLEAHGIMSPLIYALKGSSEFSIFSPLARLFLQIHGVSLGRFPAFEELVLVSAPKSTIRLEPDHAESWCQALAGYLPATQIFRSGIYRGCPGESLPSQKHLSRSLRSRRQVEFNRDEKARSQALAKSALFVFCDDLITTGSTATATHLALGSPKNFVVCTIAVALSQCYNASQ